MGSRFAALPPSAHLLMYGNYGGRYIVSLAGAGQTQQVSIAGKPSLPPPRGELVCPVSTSSSLCSPYVRTF